MRARPGRVDGRRRRGGRRRLRFGVVHPGGSDRNELPMTPLRCERRRGVRNERVGRERTPSSTTVDPAGCGRAADRNASAGFGYDAARGRDPRKGRVLRRLKFKSRAPARRGTARPRSRPRPTQLPPSLPLPLPRLLPRSARFPCLLASVASSCRLHTPRSPDVVRGWPVPPLDRRSPGRQRRRWLGPRPSSSAGRRSDGFVG